MVSAEDIGGERDIEDEGAAPQQRQRRGRRGRGVQPPQQGARTTPAPRRESRRFEVDEDDIEAGLGFDDEEELGDMFEEENDDE